jgi:hypothetical protein
MPLFTKIIFPKEVTFKKVENRSKKTTASYKIEAFDKKIVKVLKLQTINLYIYRTDPIMKAVRFRYPARRSKNSTFSLFSYLICFPGKSEIGDKQKIDIKTELIKTSCFRLLSKFT